MLSGWNRLSHPHNLQAFQRSRLFIQGLCRGKEAWKLEESLVGSVEVPLPGPQLCLQIDQKVEEINLYISDFLTPTSERLFGTLRPSASNPKAPTYLLQRDNFIQTQCVLWKMQPTKAWEFSCPLKYVREHFISKNHTWNCLSGMKVPWVERRIRVVSLTIASRNTLNVKSIITDDSK